MGKREMLALAGRVQVLHATVQAMREGLRFSQLPYERWRRK